MIEAILPGVTVEVVAGEREADRSVSGVVTMPLVLDWGAPVTTVRRGGSTLAALGHTLSDLKLVNEVMNYADVLILYRRNTGTQALGELNAGLTVKAVYGGTRGNDLTVIAAQEEGTDYYTLRTFLDTTEVDSQRIASPGEYQENGYILLEGEGDLKSATVKLSGGGNGEAGELEAYFNTIEQYDYTVMAYTGTDQAEMQRIAAFTRQQYARGCMTQCVVSGTGFNDKLVICSTIGGSTLGYSLTPAEACATMSGIQAKCGIQESATGYPVIGWTGVSARLTREQQEQRTQNGETLFIWKYGGAEVLYDVNSLTAFTAQNPRDFSKNLVIRTLNHYAADLEKLLEQRVKGKLRRSAVGKNQTKGLIAAMTVADYLNPGYLESFSADDVTVTDGADRDSIEVSVGITIADTVDKIYVTVTAL